MNGQALVTGAGKRLGREIALYLAGRGLDVAVHYNSSSDEAEEVAQSCRDKGVKSATLRANLIDESEIQTLVPRAVDALGGPLTVLVNSASIFEDDTIETATRESWDRHLESNLRAPFVLTQAFAAQVPAYCLVRLVGLVISRVKIAIHTETCKRFGACRRPQLIPCVVL
ncbi:MAG: SDR family NAD(P)-dependent oxidoreductase, partial [Pseudomonadota bacterium]